MKNTRVRIAKQIVHSVDKSDIPFMLCNVTLIKKEHYLSTPCIHTAYANCGAKRRVVDLLSF